jgi:aerobic carbon-monoxide dehydrogenase medium subunit
MKPAAVDYVRAKSLGEAIELLAADPEARVIAGGQSLVAMMNLRVATPSKVVDISRLPELTAVSEDAEAVTFGACVTHAMIEDGRVPDPSRGLMPRAASTLAYRAIRNRGTLGGSLALADPAAEWPAVLAALDAEALIDGPQGPRRHKCIGFATGVFETVLAPGEIVTAVRVRKLPAATRWGYVKLCRKLGEFAHSLAIAILGPEEERVVVGAANGPPLALDAASDIEGQLTRAGRHFGEFEHQLHQVAARRALAEARR